MRASGMGGIGDALYRKARPGLARADPNARARSLV
jgi:hypothetical protein